LFGVQIFYSYFVDIHVFKLYLFVIDIIVSNKLLLFLEYYVVWIA